MQVSTNSVPRGQQPHLYHDDTQTKPIVHSGRLVYAKPQDLPSFPSIGLDARGSAASAAASLGWANKKSPEPWRPTASPSAWTAAIMAEDYKLAPAWEPVASSDGAKAALLAAKSATSPGIPKSPSMDDGISAATRAYKSSRASSSIKQEAPERHRSLVAAKGAVARRQRADSAPAPRESYPDEANAAANALSAATRAHRPALSPIPLEEAGAVPYTTMNKLMFTSRPPVKPEVDEQKRNDVLHASAVAMAKKMYNQQQKMIDAQKAHVDTLSPRSNLEVSSSVSDDHQPAQLTTLQDAAYKQAQARLAKMQQKNAQDSDLQDYYGTKPLSRRFSVKGKLRKRSFSDGAVLEDQRRSEQIRKQMTVFSNKLSEVDQQKRQQDQDQLLAAAQRNVHERLKGMDAKIANETGMAPPSTLTQWELKARAIAQARAFSQNNPHQGKVDIGGVQMDQEEINVIAAKRIQPILDEINAKAELEHARQAELRLEMQRKKEEEETEKARQREVQDIQKKLKQQEKQEQKERKAEEKAARAEQKRLARIEKTKSAEHNQGANIEPDVQENTKTVNSSSQPVLVPSSSTRKARRRASSENSEDSPKSPSGKIKTWLKSRFSRDQSLGRSNSKRFIGGASLTGNRNNQSSVSLGDHGGSIREVALAGRDSGPPQSRLEHDSEAVSSLSNASEDEAENQPKRMLTPPRPIRDASPAVSRSPARDSRFHEII
ncbi:hypothetical protein F5B22DRAFT_579587 [Xylaria bambusicola]|uniref:uncharacterized protein n=1 Tax=Xylaria bambusicola TaxID=326684 RepID=UPI002007E097|nr:uncharacterized protein F5B22DRAFT_579587 [Xylaria bambusicola]KAI0502990.1 hypothetical protein F5B22DRAFT_579587 [Xylaria bambusicola]